MKPVIAIIGAGFSGSVLAARLLRQAATPLHVVLINRGRAASGLARGLAYGTQSPDHLLNVPAGRMSAFPENEDDFLRHLGAAGVEARGGSFVARHHYGAYLSEVLREAVEACPPGVEYSQRTGEVTDLAREGERSLLFFADGETLAADRVVLALGNFAPADPKLPDPGFLHSPRYVRDPWAPGALEGLDPRQPIALIGTGLTMYDAALTLAQHAPERRIIAFSRRGHTPLPHREATHAPRFDHAPAGITEGPARARAYLRALREEVRRAEKAGIDWREVVASLRPMTPALWRRLPESERARFLRHLRPYWEVHRHRAAPRVAAVIERLIAGRQLEVRAARLIAVADRGGHLGLALRPRGSEQVELLKVGALVNCTGPGGDFRAAGERLLLSLELRGDVQPDPLGLGLAVDEALQIRDRQGSTQAHWHCVGPLLRARDWEATAVPELRLHVRDLARTLLASL